jgi:hypothetical protein
MTAPTEKLFENSIGATVLYAKSTVDDSLVAVKINPATGAIQVDTEISASLDPTGLATSAKQDTLAGLIGEVQATPTSNTLQDRLKSAVAHLATLAGAVSSSKVQVGIDQATANANHVEAGYSAVRTDVLFTGMDATSQYDAVGALVEVPNWASAVGRSATIREMRISVNNNAIAPQFEVHFFRAADATVAADNASWTELAAEYAKRAGYIIMPACAKATGSGTIDMVRAQMDDYGQGMSKEITCAAASSSIWIKLKLLNSGISFAATPGNTIVLSIVREKS